MSASAEGRNTRYEADTGVSTAREVAPTPKLLFIGGWPRSGSTVVHRVLGEVDGWIACGEVAYIWQQGLIDGGRCGCGRPVLACSFWGDVLDLACGRVTRARVAQLSKVRDALRSHYLLRVLVAQDRRELPTELVDYLETTEALYSAIGVATGAAVIVDSSKDPWYAWFLRAFSDIDLRLVHLVRDPRATAWSWQRLKSSPSESVSPMPIFGIFRATVLWDWWNCVAEAAGRRDRQRYLRIRYEDFMSGPDNAVAAIIRFANEGAELPRALEGNHVALPTAHTIWGNPNRFQTGAVELRLDDEWVHSMPRGRRLAISLLAGPLLRHYGYRRAWARP